MTRKFHPESTSNPTGATIETLEINAEVTLSDGQKNAIFMAAHYFAARQFCRTLNPPLGFNAMMRIVESAFGGASYDVLELLKTNLRRAWEAGRPKKAA